MKERRKFLIVKRVGGMFRQSAQRFLTVAVDGHHVGVLGDETSVEPGSRWVTVETSFFTFRTLRVELKPGASTSLEYRVSWLALASVVFGSVLLMALAFPAALFLEHLGQLIQGDQLPPVIGLIVLLALLWMCGWVAFWAPLQLLAASGFYRHSLSVEGLNSSTHPHELHH